MTQQSSPEQIQIVSLFEQRRCWNWISCQNKLTFERNYSNVYCWNCLFKIAKRNGDKEVAEKIADEYL